jgi:glycosyltransferase involved in cell wall biosynthesis
MPSLSLLIPAFNEQDTIFDVLNDNSRVLDRAWRTGIIEDFEIIVLNDGSTDQTSDQIKKFHSNKLTILESIRPSGLQQAYSKLTERASKDWTIIVPGDGQWPAESIGKMLDYADSINWSAAIIGARRHKGNVYGFRRHLISWVFRQLSTVCLGQDVVDPGTVKILPSAVNSQSTVCRSPVQEIERLAIVKHLLGFRIVVIEVDWVTRLGGQATGTSRRNLTSSLLEIPKLIYICGKFRFAKN